jgi:predicted alpha/beta superfamily hydrolase
MTAQAKTAKARPDAAKPGGPPSAPPPRAINGEFRVHENFHSQFLPTDRTVVVLLPPGYDPNAARRYPVLYLHDGQNVFDPTTAFGGNEWHVDDTTRSLITSHAIEPLIVVGVYNAGEKRIDEYTPTRIKRKKGGGQADLYGRLLVEELKPLIDREYKTLPSAASTGLGGSSLGGLVTLYLGLKYPTVFGRLAILSPSVWWDDRVIIRRVAELPSKPPLRIWLDAGTGEGKDVIDDTRALRDALVAKGWVLDQDLKYYEAQGHAHHENAWAARMGEVLRFLFPGES